MWSEADLEILSAARERGMIIDAEMAFYVLYNPAAQNAVVYYSYVELVAAILIVLKASRDLSAMMSVIALGRDGELFVADKHMLFWQALVPPLDGAVE